VTRWSGDHHPASALEWSEAPDLLHCEHKTDSKRT